MRDRVALGYSGGMATATNPEYDRPGGGTVTVEVFTQDRYRCPTCRRSWASKYRCRDHIIAGCWKDPANRGCLTCRHYDPGSTNHGPEDPGEEPHCKIDAPESYVEQPPPDLIKILGRIGFGPLILCNSWEPTEESDRG